MNSNIQTNILYLDCTCGISGDMTVAALLDLGADQKILIDTLHSLPLDGYEIAVSYVQKSGLKACNFHVILDPVHENHDHDMAYLHGSEADAARILAETSPAVNLNTSADNQECISALPEEHDHHEQEHYGEEHHEHEHHEHEHHGHEHHEHEHHKHEHHEHGHHKHEHHGHEHREHEHHGHEHHHHHGRNLDDVTRILKAGSMTPRALELALKMFRIVAEAESQVHGKPLNEVHFHEVGAVDSIIDIAAVAICIDNLGIDRVIIPALTEGTGQVRCQHGLLPIPVPATAAIAAAHRLTLHITPIQGELVTPTGAAIAAALCTDRELPSEFQIRKIGLGAGKRDYANAGILRAMLIVNEHSLHDQVLVLETNMDDCSGEAMGFTLEELMDAGALDAFYTPIYMKKHRPAYKLTVLCSRDLRKEMEQIIFCHTTTIGLRCYLADRTRLGRSIQTLETPWGIADIKICTCREKHYCYPESDSIMRIARATGLGYTELYHKIKSYADTQISETAE